MLEPYINLKILGREKKGEITKKVKSIEDQKIYVLKNLGEQQLTDEQKEIINLLQKEECPYIVKHYPVNKNNEIKTDFINDVDLQDYLNAFIDLEKPIEEKVLWKIFLQCIESIRYLHNNKIIHRNIRLENFYMTDDKEIKLGNFRYAIYKNDENSNFNFFDDGILYKTEETLNNFIYNEKSDIFALGVVFYKLCYFEFPYEISLEEDEANENKGIYKLIKKNHENPEYSQELITFINKMINKIDRPDIKAIYDEARENYIKYCCEDSCIESVLRGFSTFGTISNEESRSVAEFQSYENDYPALTGLFYACKYLKENDKGNKDEYLNNFKKLFEEYIISKKGKHPRPFDVAKFIIERYTRDCFYKVYNICKKNEEYKNCEGYFNGRLDIKEKNNDKGKHLFNIMSINLDKCKKNENNNYDIEKMISQNDFSDNLDNNYHYHYFQRYIIISIDRGKNYNNKSPISFPERFQVKNLNINPYLLTGFIIRKIINDEEKFFFVRQARGNGEHIKWKLLGKNKQIENIEFETKEEAKNYSDGLIEMLFYKIERN